MVEIRESRSITFASTGEPQQTQIADAQQSQMNQPDIDGLPTDRRGWLKRIGIGALSLTAMQSAYAETGQTQGTDLSFDIALGEDPWLDDFEEFDDYHSIDDSIGGFKARLTISSQGQTFICLTSILEGMSFPLSERLEVTPVENASNPHEEFHSFTTELLDGQYTLYGLVFDVENEQVAVETADFTVV